jgi:hypothetical protein
VRCGLSQRDQGAFAIRSSTRQMVSCEVRPYAGTLRVWVVVVVVSSGGGSDHDVSWYTQVVTGMGSPGGMRSIT